MSFLPRSLRLFRRTLRSGFLAQATVLALCLAPYAAAAQAHPVAGSDVMRLTEQYLKAAPKRFIGSPGHAAAEQFLRDHFRPKAISLPTASPRTRPSATWA